MRNELNRINRAIDKFFLCTNTNIHKCRTNDSLENRFEQTNKRKRKTKTEYNIVIPIKQKPYFSNLKITIQYRPARFVR